MTFIQYLYRKKFKSIQIKFLMYRKMKEVLRKVTTDTKKSTWYMFYRGLHGLRTDMHQSTRGTDQVEV